jgi:hypothetical protein
MKMKMRMRMNTRMRRWRTKWWELRRYAMLLDCVSLDTLSAAEIGGEARMRTWRTRRYGKRVGVRCNLIARLSTRLQPRALKGEL